jgi:hypothetical protein
MLPRSLCPSSFTSFTNCFSYFCMLAYRRRDCLVEINDCCLIGDNHTLQTSCQLAAIHNQHSIIGTLQHTLWPFASCKSVIAALKSTRFLEHFILHTSHGFSKDIFNVPFLHCLNLKNSLTDFSNMTGAFLGEGITSNSMLS